MLKTIEVGYWRKLLTATPTNKVTDDHVEVNAVLGVEEPDPRLITTGQTSASPHGCNRRSQWGGRRLGWMR